MSTLKINLGMTSKSDLIKYAAFLTSLAGEKTIPVDKEVLENQNAKGLDTPEKKIKKLKTPEDKPSKKEIPVKEKPAEKADKPAKDQSKEIKALVIEKAVDHRDAIKKKLTELDAANVTKLDEEHHQDFLDFLNDL